MNKTKRNRAGKAQSKRTDSRRCAVASGSAQWEYHTEYSAKHMPEREMLNQLGSEGWELCATLSTLEPPSDMSSLFPGVTKYFFKRAIQPNNKSETRDEKTQ